MLVLWQVDFNPMAYWLLFCQINLVSPLNDFGVFFTPILGHKQVIIEHLRLHLLDGFF
jgi:hypothetical protein